MLPFRDNAQIRACNPLKMREYLAAGTPIVATPFAALDPYKGLVHVVNERAAFADYLRSAAADIHRNDQRRERVRNESWESRACDISSALARL